MSVGQPRSIVAPGPYDGPEWGPRPPRSRAGLVTRFVLTVLYFPLHVVLWIVVAALFLVVAQVAELVCAVLPFLEKHADGLFDRWAERFPVRPRWWVSWPELRHEGDAAYAAERVERHLAKRTEQARKTANVKESYGVHRYRAIGARAVLEIAWRYGWSVDEQKRNEPARRIHLLAPRTVPRDNRRSG